MKVIIGSTNITDLVAYGFTYEREPQYAKSITTMDGLDHTAKIRDIVKLTVPIIPLTEAQLGTVLALFPSGGAYVSVTYSDPITGADRTVQFKYETRTANIKVKYSNGKTYWDGLVISLTER